MFPTPARAVRCLLAAGIVVLALGARESLTRAAEAPTAWKIYRDQNCGLEFRYPASYELKASSAKDFCAPSVSVRGLFELDVEEMDNAERQALAQSGKEISPRSFALSRAMVRCMADGPDGSTYCTETVKEISYKTAKGFDAYEFYLTEVHEHYGEKKRIEKQIRGPIIAVDISDDEAIRVLLIEPSERSLATAKAAIDTLRVWTKARRQQPRVIELNPLAQTRGAFTIRVVSDELPRPASVPPRPMINVFVTDPLGHRRGVDPATEISYAETPAITSWTARENAVMLRSAPEGRYEVLVSSSVASARYKLIIHAPDRSGKQSTAEYINRTAEPGSMDRYEVVYSKAFSPPVKIAAVKDVSRLTLLLTGLEGGVTELVLVDPRGRRTGLDPAAGAAYREIPRSSYLEERAERRTVMLDIQQPSDGAYELQVIGTGAGNYALDVRGLDRNGDVTSRPHFRAIPAVAGAVHRYVLNYSPLPRAPLSVSGGFNGGAQKSGSGDAFLTYANPISPETRLPAGQAAFPLLVFYGGSINPVTFTAMLNDTNISSRFTPEPGTFQMVFIPLRSGSNTFVLSVDGTTAAGQPATDTDRLLFWVP